MGTIDWWEDSQLVIDKWMSMDQGGALDNGASMSYVCPQTKLPFFDSALDTGH